MTPQMMARRVVPADFKAALGRQTPMVGTFVKTAAHEQIEVLGLSGLDMVCLDAEHAPFDRRDLDGCLLAARASGLPCLVRVPALDPVAVLQALDMGATGVVVPHIRSLAAARELARISAYGPGGRGYAGSTRAADYTLKPMARHLEQTAAQAAVIAQIEDVEALTALDDIMAVAGIDGVLIGRVDLTVALGAAAVTAPEVEAAVDAICRAAASHGRAVGMFLPDLTQAAHWIDRGMCFFLVGADQGFVLNGARALQGDFTALLSQMAGPRDAV